jgi:tetratricopeptide (TPR) repeat protein
MQRHHRSIPVPAFAAALCLIFGWLPPSASAQINACGPLGSDQFGPFDFRTVSSSNLSLVERNHFNADVERLVRGQTSSIGADLAYTLRSIPNHPRALASMARLARKEKRPTPNGAVYSVDCWFDRAIRFAANDPTVRIVYGIELLRDGRNADAISQLNVALDLAPGDANAHYNLGLAYFSERDYNRSLVHAKQAYQSGFPLPGLREKLQRAGAWKD